MTLSLTHWLTHWLTDSLTDFYFWHTQSDTRDLWPLQHLIRELRRHDLTEKIPTNQQTSPPSYLFTSCTEFITHSFADTLRPELEQKATSIVSTFPTILWPEFAFIKKFLAPLNPSIFSSFQNFLNWTWIEYNFAVLLDGVFYDRERYDDQKCDKKTLVPASWNAYKRRSNTQASLFSRKISFFL